MRSKKGVREEIVRRFKRKKERIVSDGQEEEIEIKEEGELRTVRRGNKLTIS